MSESGDDGPLSPEALLAHAREHWARGEPCWFTGADSYSDEAWEFAIKAMHNSNYLDTRLVASLLAHGWNPPADAADCLSEAMTALSRYAIDATITPEQRAAAIAKRERMVTTIEWAEMGSNVIFIQSVRDGGSAKVGRKKMSERVDFQIWQAVLERERELKLKRNHKYRTTAVDEAGIRFHKSPEAIEAALRRFEKKHPKKWGIKALLHGIKRPV